LIEQVQKYEKIEKLWKLSAVNVFIWSIALVELLFILQDCPCARGFYVILSGGAVLGIILLCSLLKIRQWSRE